MTKQDKRNRDLFCVGEITTKLATRLIGDLIKKNAEIRASGEGGIVLYINSMGGEVTEGLAIYDTIQMIETPVATICLGQASSMAAYILMGGTKGHRYMTSNARVLLHPGDTSVEGERETVKSTVEEIDKLGDLCDRIAAKHTGQPLRKIRQDSNTEFYMGATQAKKYGIVDKIIRGKNK